MLRRRCRRRRPRLVSSARDRFGERRGVSPTWTPAVIADRPLRRKGRGKDSLRTLPPAARPAIGGTGDACMAAPTPGSSWALAEELFERGDLIATAILDGTA